MRWWNKSNVKRKLVLRVTRGLQWCLAVALITACGGRSVEGQCGPHRDGENLLLSSCEGHPRGTLAGAHPHLTAAARRGSRLVPAPGHGRGKSSKQEGLSTILCW